MKSSTITKRMKGIFFRLGNPERVISDNQTCFTSAEFTQFAKGWDFESISSTPHYSQGKGFSGAYVKKSKRIFTKAKSANTDPLIGLVEYRNTALSSTNFSLPAAHLVSYQLRSILPSSKEKFMPHHISPDIILSRLQAYRQVGKSYFDRRTNPLGPLEIRNPARIQHMQKKTGNKPLSLTITMTDHCSSPWR